MNFRYETDSRENPFVVGVMADFHADSTAIVEPRERRFMTVDRDTFDHVMQRMAPALDYPVDNLLDDEGGRLQVALRFNSLDDFLPARVIAQVEPLRQLLAGLPGCNPSTRALLENRLSRQLRAIMRHARFRGLEGSWRGLHYLMDNSDGCLLQIRILSLARHELAVDLDEQDQLEQSALYRWLHGEFWMPGGEPFGVLIGDYEFTAQPDDIALLRVIARLAASAFCPFLSAAACTFFGVDDWSDLAGTQDFHAIVHQPRYHAWHAFRDSDDARFVVLTLPRVLCRLPHDERTSAVPSADQASGVESFDPRDCCWMNPGYALGARLAASFARDHWFNDIPGKLENLPGGVFPSETGELDANCPTEIGINDRWGKELSALGFLPVLHPRNADHALFLSVQTTHRPVEYCEPDATAMANITARLPYIMVASRVAQYVMCIAKLRVGGSGGSENSAEHEAYLNHWLQWYVDADGHNDTEAHRARYPFLEARIELQAPAPDDADRCYRARLFLRPWLAGRPPAMPGRENLTLTLWAEP